jgi:hypothetical protein
MKKEKKKEKDREKKECYNSGVGICEFLQLWDCIREFDLNDQENRHIWKLDASGSYSSKSAYTAYCFGSIIFEPCETAVEILGPKRAKFFCGWQSVIGVGQ